MSVKFLCPCGRGLKAAADMIGKQVVCPVCRARVCVPSNDGETAQLAPESTARVAGQKLKSAATERKERKQSRIADELEDREYDLGVDVKGTVLSLAGRFLPGLVLIALLTWGAYWFSSKILEIVSDRPELGRVSGQVTLDGQPVAGATVMFVPVPDANSKVKAAPSLGRTDQRGWYELFYVRDLQGAAVGKHRVQIRGAGPDGRPLPNWEPIETVKPGGQEILFPLKTK